MTVDLAKEYVALRMKDLGFENNYYLRFKHLVLQAGETRELGSDNQLFILVEEVEDISISSDFGAYDLADTSLNEQVYEHQGSIAVYNYSADIAHVRFIQVIPKN